MNSSFLKDANTTMNMRFRPDIEGLRAIGILLVAGYHANIPGFNGGYIGVDVFFVLSGYLITWLLVQEADKSGTINLIQFYSRRARRLLPAMFLMLAITIPIGAALYAPFEQRVFANSSITTAAYISNLYFAREATDYLGADSETNPYLHTWSLSVEEQFYFFWPIFIMFALGTFKWQKHKNPCYRLLYWMGAVAGISLLASMVLTKTNQPLAFFLSPVRAWEFAVGALAVLLPQKKKGMKPLFQSNIMSWIGLAGILSAAMTFDKSTVFPGYSACLPVLATALILRAGAVDINNNVTQILKIKPLQEIGRLSYSWYLWHWPVLIFAASIKAEMTLLEKLGCLLLSLIIAEASYRYVENPLRHNKLLIRKNANSLIMAALITCVSIGISYSWRLYTKSWEQLPEQLIFTEAKNDLPMIYTSGCFGKYPDTSVNMEACSGGTSSASKTMILLGDSHAANWYPALEQMAFNEDWRLLTLAKSACPPISEPIIDKNLGREYTECSEWLDSALKTIKNIQPDLVITTASSGYELISEDKWEKGFDPVLQTLSENSNNVLFIKDTPHLKFRSLDYLARKEWTSKLFTLDSYDAIIKDGKSEQVYDVQKQLIEKYENINYVDMNDLIFSKKPILIDDLYRDKMFVFWDSSHITATFMKSIGSKVALCINAAIEGENEQCLVSEDL